MIELSFSSIVILFLVALIIGMVFGISLARPNFH